MRAGTAAPRRVARPPRARRSAISNRTTKRDADLGRVHRNPVSCGVPTARIVRLLPLALVPLSLLAPRLGAGPVLVFLLAGLAIVPLADWIRRATEQVAATAGSAIGGLLNVTFGNAAELILALFILARGSAAVVKASITGSIIGNSLLSLGLAILVGGWSRERQKFGRE